MIEETVKLAIGQDAGHASAAPTLLPTAREVNADRRGKDLVKLFQFPPMFGTPNIGLADPGIAGKLSAVWRNRM